MMNLLKIFPSPEREYYETLRTNPYEGSSDTAKEEAITYIDDQSV